MRFSICFWFHLAVHFCNWCTEGVNIEKLKDIVKGVKISEEEGSVEIDQDHLQKNPECGFIPENSEARSSSSRISNAEESDKHYPWMIFVLRRNSAMPGFEPGCGGAIITQKTAITGSHCICGVPEGSPIRPGMEWQAECAGGMVTDLNLMPSNEITSFNNLVARIGDKDKQKYQNELPILIAYVMGSNMRQILGIPNPLPVDLYEDIGLLMTVDRGNGDKFYKHNRPYRQGVNFNVGPVCLAAAKEKAPHMYEGKIVTVGWGRRYDGVKIGPANVPEQQQHSCATNEYGPIDAKLQHCDVKEITKPRGWGCNRSDMPEGYDTVKCEEYLKQAETSVMSKIKELGGSEMLSTLWSLTNKIEISGGLFHTEYTCYKQKLFDENGWCYVFPWMNKVGGKEKNWGFCGSSCKLMQAPQTSPSIYHKMVWEYPFKQPTRCPDEYHNNPDPNQNSKPYYICMSSFLPKTSVFKFERDGKTKLKFSDAYKEEIEDTFGKLTEVDKKNIGYQLPCRGDSGSGHWMYDSTKNRRALVAITSHGLFDAQIGKFCGGPTHSLLTTHPDILRWIKKFSGISDQNP